MENLPPGQFPLYTSTYSGFGSIITTIIQMFSGCIHPNLHVWNLVRFMPGPNNFLPAFTLHFSIGENISRPPIARTGIRCAKTTKWRRKPVKQVVLRQTLATEARPSRPSELSLHGKRYSRCPSQTTETPVDETAGSSLSPFGGVTSEGAGSRYSAARPPSNPSRPRLTDNSQRLCPITPVVSFVFSCRTNGHGPCRPAPLHPLARTKYK